MVNRDKFKRQLITIVGVTLIATTLVCSSVLANSIDNFVVKNSYSEDLFIDIKNSDWFHNDVKECYEVGLVDGKSTGVFDPDGLRNFNNKNTYSKELFTDISQTDWYYKDANKVYELGLMSGKGNRQFDAKGNVTIVEAIVIASRVNDIYSGGNGIILNTGSNWYDGSVKYAKDKEIINEGDFSNYNKLATRTELAYIFSRALPENEYELINNISSVPDVDSNTKYKDNIYKLYNSGIIRGNGSEGYFQPNKNITRAEASSIINRVVNKSSRQMFILNLNQQSQVTPQLPQGTQKVGNITVKYGKHTYGVANQQQYDKVMNAIEGHKASVNAKLAQGNLEKSANWIKLQSYKNGTADKKTSDWVNKHFNYLVNFSDADAKQVIMADTVRTLALNHTKSTGNQNGESAYELMFEGRGDCNASSYTDQAAFDAMGFNTRIMYDNTHAWCEVNIGGQWYNTDGGLYLASEAAVAKGILVHETYPGGVPQGK